MKHGVIIAVVGILIFIGFGSVVLASSNGCGLGSRNNDESLNDTQARSDDQSFFTRAVCSAMRAKHNR